MYQSSKLDELTFVGVLPHEPLPSVAPKVLSTNTVMFQRLPLYTTPP